MSAVLFILSLPALVVGGYLGLLGVVAGAKRPNGPAPALSRPCPHFTFVVPAHDEALGIERTVLSILGIDYPVDRFSVLVVADNCTDDTASRARGAGARVLERTEPRLRGKGYALRWAFDALLRDGATDAVVVVDADSDVEPNILRYAAAQIAGGARAIQMYHGVRNADESWRTRLMDVAFSVYHGVRSEAREVMALSVGLRGNGMVFALETLRAVPYQAFSLVEDVEYGIELALRGIRVVYLGDARVLGEMVSGGDGAESQRRRWESGRRGLLCRYFLLLARRGMVERNWMLLDLACDMVVPPLSTVIVYVLVGTLSAVVSAMVGASGAGTIFPWMVSLLGVVVYVGRGVRLAGRGFGVVGDAIYVPYYILWKLTLPLRNRTRRRGEWVRTARKGKPD